MSEERLQLCPACGMPVADGAAFCDACGAELHAEPVGARTARPPEQTGNSHAETAENTEPGRGFPLPSNLFPPAAEPAGASSRTTDNILAAVQAILASRRAAAASTPAPTVFVPAQTIPERSAVSFTVPAPTPPPAPSLSLRTAVSPPPLVSSPSLSLPKAAPVPALEFREVDDPVPFQLEWDGDREFIEGQAGQLAFRLRASCDLKAIGIAASVDGTDLTPVIVSKIRSGETRESSFDFVPNVSGILSVKLCAEVQLSGRTVETYEAERTLNHQVLPAQRISVHGAGSVIVKVENNSGIVRNDDLNLSALRGEKIDHWKDFREVFGRRGAFRPVAFTPTAIRHESIRFRATGAALDELLVVPGADMVTFGKSSSRTDVRLVAETADGCRDSVRSGYVSNVHFSLRRSRSNEEIAICDGGPLDGSAWRESTNGLNIDGEPLTGSRTLPADRRMAVTLAPYTISGGAIPLELETRGWDDPAAAGCADRSGTLSSVLVRRLDNPRKAVLVVWGAADLDALLGTRNGLRVASIRGRLHAVYPDGSARRLMLFSGHALPGTSVFVQ